jgi:ethanolamine ammonia-lyase small subunit
VSDADEWAALTAFTPARLALGRAGNALPTRRVLEFQLAHARAQDAVQAPFDADALARELAPAPVLRLQTRAADRADYLMNPDHGRMLDEASATQLSRGTFDAALVIADGLSATAIHAHGAALAKLVLAGAPDLTWAPISIVHNGRVAVGDAIAAGLGADMAVVLIGERPGLSAADAVGIYLTWRPVPGVTRDAERNCISNVRPAGLPLAEAAHRLSWLMTQARKLGATGIALKEDAPEQLQPPVQG